MRGTGDPMSTIGSCMVAATLNLPIDKNLGYAWVIPYGNKAQFQLGYKGYIQLALRTGQYKSINVIEVYEGELIKWNRLTEDLVLMEDQKASNAVIGYAAYFELVNGFRKVVYWTRGEVIRHRDRFSKQAQGKVWREDFDAMALKTVLKNMLSKWGILSIEMQKAFKDDDRQFEASENSDDVIDVTPSDYFDVEQPSVDPETGEINEQGELIK